MINKTEQSYTQLDSKKQVIACWDRVTTIHEESSTPTSMSKINSRQIQSNIENFEEIRVLNAEVNNSINSLPVSQNAE